MDRLAFLILLAVLVLSPIPFGSVHVYAYSLLFLMILAAVLLLLVKNLRRSRSSSRKFVLRIPETPFSPLFLMMLLYLIIQLLPLPSFLVGFLSPSAKSLDPNIASLSPYVYPVRMSLLRWLVYGFFFYGLIQVLNSRKRIEITLITLLLSASFNSLYGIYEFYLGANRVLWFTKLGQTVSGTFLNRNHFGAFMALAIILGVVYIYASTKATETAGDLTWRQRLRRSLTNEQLFSKNIFISSCILAAGLGLILCSSRGAILALAISLLVFFVPFFQNKKQRRLAVAIALVFVAIAGASQMIGKSDTWKRFGETDAPMASRLRYTSQSLKMFTDFPLTGVGFGNFQHAFPKYQSPEDTRQFIEHAHNDWVQLLAEGGLLGFSLFLTGALVYIRALIKQWRRRRDHYAKTLGMLSLISLVYMAIHSLFDFNLHVPANALLFIALQVIGLAALQMRKNRSRRKTSYFSYHRLPLKGKGGIALVLILGLILWSGTTVTRHMLAEFSCNTVLNRTLKRDPLPPSEDIQRAIALDGGNSGYWFKLAKQFQEQRKAIKPTNDLDIRQEKMLSMVVRNLLQKSSQLNPFNAFYPQTLAWEYSAMWRDPDFEQKWLPMADRAMTRAETLAGTTYPRLLQDIGNFWIYRSRRFTEEGEKWQQLVDKAAQDYERAYVLEEKGKKRNELYLSILSYVDTMYPGDSLMSRKIRERIEKDDF